MAAQAGNSPSPSPKDRGSRSSGAARASQPASSRSSKPSSVFGLLPAGKHQGKPMLPLTRPVLLVGTRENCRIRLNSSSISRIHALLVKSGNSFYVRDLASRTGVLVDGRKVREHLLRDGEKLALGSFLLKFVAPPVTDDSDSSPSAAATILPASLVPISDAGGGDSIGDSGGEMPVPIEDRVLLIGRRPGSDVKLLEESASSSHAVIFEMDGRHFIRDLGSRTGTLVNGVKVHQHCLNADDRIRIGDTQFRYRPSPEEAAAPLEAFAPAEPATLADEAAPMSSTIAPPQETAAPAVEDFGLELLPSEHPVSPDVDTSILPGRRGWRAPSAEAAPPMPPPAESVPVELAPSEPQPALGETHLPIAEQPPVDAPMALAPADEKPIELPPLDFDETTLVNRDSGPADLIDFAPEEKAADEKTTEVIEPLFSAAGLAELADADRIQSERLAAEQAERERVEADRVAAKKAEAERLAAEQAERERVEAERVAAEKAEVERLAAEQAERERVAAERIAAEKAEAERREAERLATEQAERERVAAEKAEAERLAAEQADRERVEAERVAAEKAEAERLAAEQAERDRVEAERLAAEKAEAERREAERLAAEQAERERLEAERIAAEKAEAERLAAEQAEHERIEAERVAAEKAEAERLAAEKAERERIEAERAASEKAEAERREADRLAAEQAERERLEAERVAAEKAEAERLAAEQAERERVQAERLAAEKAEAERREAERLAAEQAERERLETERVAAERAEAQRLEAERQEAERREAERLAAERQAAERQAAELEEATRRIEAERVLAEQEESERLIAGCLTGEETIEATEPTPESALELGLVEPEPNTTPSSGDDQSATMAMPYFDAAITASLSDSSFGRALEDFSGNAAGLLVEPAQASPDPSEPLEPSSLDPLSASMLSSSAPDQHPALEARGHELPAPDAVLGEATLLEVTASEATVPETTVPESGAVEADPFDRMVEPIAEVSEHVDGGSSDMIDFGPEIETELPPAEIASHSELDLSKLQTSDELPAVGDSATEPRVEGAAASFREPAGESAGQVGGDLASDVDDWEPLPGTDLGKTASDATAVIAPPTSPAAPAITSTATSDAASSDAAGFDAAEFELGGSFATWGGNQFNFLGGQPVVSPPLTAPPLTAQPASLQPVAPQPPLPAPAVGMVSVPPPVAESHDAAAPKELSVQAPDADAEIESVSAMIDEILVGEAIPSSEPFSKSPQPIAPASIASKAPATPQQLDAGAATGLGGAALGKLEADITSEMVDDGAMPAIPLPRSPRRPLRRGLAELDRKQAREPADAQTPDAEKVLRIDEQIPPFGTPLEQSHNPLGRLKSSEPDPLVSLAKPPVQETDVFATMSPTSSEPDGEEAGESFVEDPLMPSGRGAAGAVSTPMDMVFDETNGSRHLSGRVRGGRRVPPTLRDPAPGATGATGAAVTGRADLPVDPFWSGAANIGGESGLGASGLGASGLGGDLPPLADMADALPPRGRHAVRPTTPARSLRRFKSVKSQQSKLAFAAPVDHTALLAERRRRLRQVPLLVLLGAALIGADLLAIWKFLAPKSIVDAKITFRNAANLDPARRHDLAERQKQVLEDDSTRHLAQTELSKQNPEIPPGFLDDATDYAQVVDSASWPDLDRDVMVLSRSTTDVEGDIPRLRAIGVAVYDNNGPLIDEAERTRHNLEEAQGLIDDNTRSINDLQKQRIDLMAIADGRPSPEEMVQLHADQDRLQKAWNDAVVALNNAKADLDRLQKQPPISLDDGSSTPAAAGGTGGTAALSSGAAGASVTASSADDDQVKQLQTQLAAVQAQVDAAKARHFEQAKAARAALDQSLAQFEQQVADAKQMTRDNPELTAYIAAAQKFQETTRSLVDELMRRQQQQYAQLTDLQSRLNDKMQQRREELWQKDEQLQRMNDALEYAKRQLNAALGTGQEQQANDLKAEIALRETTIKAREDMIPVDPIYADAISQLQKIVDQQQKSMAEDRQTTAKALEEAQNEFANSQPAVDKLPDEQKSLAADMEKRLADLTTARAKYSEAAAAMDDGQDEETRKLQEQANSIATSIDLHRKQVADSTSKQEAQALESKRQKDIADKQTQITQLTQAVADAQAAYNAKVDELQDKQARLDKSRQAGEQLQALSDKQALLQKQIAQLQADLEFKKEAARDSVEPVMITDADIHQHPGLDKRLPYALETSIPLLLLCLGSVFWTIHLASRELPLNALSPTDDDGHPEPFSLPSPAKAGHNGASAGANGVNGHGPQEHANGETATALASLSGSDDDATGEATGATMADVPEAGRGEGDSQPADAMANR